MQLYVQKRLSAAHSSSLQAKLSSDQNRDACLVMVGSRKQLRERMLEAAEYELAGEGDSQSLSTACDVRRGEPAVLAVN